MAVKPAMHGRDHCPGGSDPIPCMPGGAIPTFFAWLGADSDLYSSSSTPAAVLFDLWATNYDTTVYSFTTSGGKINVVNLLLEGVYTIKFAAVWAASIGSSIVETQVAGSYDWDHSVVHAGGGNQDSFVISTTNLYPPIHEASPPTSPPFGTVQAQVSQQSGSSVRLEGSTNSTGGTILQIFYHGSSDIL